MSHSISIEKSTERGKSKEYLVVRLDMEEINNQKSSSVTIDDVNRMFKKYVG